MMRRFLHTLGYHFWSGWSDPFYGSFYGWAQTRKCKICNMAEDRRAYHYK